MTFAWTNELATGINEIDGQHKELFKRLNDLLEACKMKKGKEEIAGFLRFLEEYVIQHFATEEKEMAAVNYPGLAAQKKEHQEFTRKLAGIKREFSEYGSGINVVLTAVRMSGDWLVQHIRKTDKAMAEFMRGAGKG